MTREQFVSAVVATMQSEINADPDLRACKTFSELHDHCDANMLGGAELLLHLLGMDEATAVMELAQGRIDDWLKEPAVAV